MFSIIAVDSIRALPINAAYGFALVGILILGGLLFLLPCAFVSAELASLFPQDGGLYIWIREAFGRKTGFIAAWLLWIYNIVWFPTIIAFICATAGSAIYPDIMQHKTALYASMLVLFWIVTFVNLFGIRASSLLSTLGTIFGTLIPIIIIGALGVYWLHSKQPLAINFSLKHILPHDLSNIGLLPSVVFGLVGIEVAASFAGNVKNPQRNFPIAMFISAAVILVTLILGSLTIAMIIPGAKLNLATGVVQAFAILFQTINMPFMTNIMIFLIFIGSIGGLSTWMAGPSRNMMIAAKDGIAPKFISKSNRFGAASNMLIMQAIVFSILCSAYIIFPKFNSAYALLSNMTGELSMLVYMLLFTAAIRLRYSRRNLKRPFKLAGGNTSLWLVAGTALIICILVFIIGFIPPAALHIQHIGIYESLLITIIALTLISGIIIATRAEKK